MEVLEVVINYPFYNIKMSNVITPANVTVGFASELNKTVTNNPKIKNCLAVSLISTLSEITKKVSFSSPQSKEKLWAKVQELMSEEKHVESFTELAKAFTKYN